MADYAKSIIPYLFAKHHGVLLDTLTASTANIWHLTTLTPTILTELRRYLARPLQLTLVSPEIFQQRLLTLYQQAAPSTAQLLTDLQATHHLTESLNDLSVNVDILADQDDAPLIRFLNTLFHQAIQQRASDIHLETFRHTTVIRYRIDGKLTPVSEVPPILAPRLMTRVKVLARLDIAEQRLPQDGRITLYLADHPIDVRVAIIPSQHGERIVLRILDKSAAPLHLPQLGMTTEDLMQVQQLIHHSHGMILITGPTGCGKTTTLYALLTTLNQSSRNILTIEDPIEYDLIGIGQIPVNENIGMSFAKGLRAILRQDPDIIMVGEIRDTITAEIAIQASLTGHLVLSSLHTNDAVGAITRLRDMGIANYLLAASLVGVVAQRLIRKLCPHCKQAYVPNSAEAAMIGNACQQIYRAVGCNQCFNLGYFGRQAIFEILLVDETLRRWIQTPLDQPTTLPTLHYRQLKEAALALVVNGITDLAEVLSVVHLTTPTYRDLFAVPKRC